MRPGGTGNGTGPAINQAYGDIQAALAATGIASGDILYVAPGDYRIPYSITPDKDYTSYVKIIGDPTGSQFSGIPQGRVLFTQRASNDRSTSWLTANHLLSLNKNFLWFENLALEGYYGSTYSVVSIGAGISNIQFNKCLLLHNTNASCIVNSGVDKIKNFTFSRCIFDGVGSGSIYQHSGSQSLGGSNYVYNLTFDRCINYTLTQAINIASGNFGTTLGPTGLFVINSYGFCFAGGSGGRFRGDMYYYNSVCKQDHNLNQSTGTMVFSNCILNGVFPGYGGGTSPTLINTTTTMPTPLNTPIDRIWGLDEKYSLSSVGYGAGIGTTGPLIPTQDMFGNPWTTGIPYISPFNNYSNTLIGQYNPIEKNVSYVNLLPGTTDYSMYVNLGAAGLSSTSPNLYAFYVRSKSNPVQISLVSQTPTASYISGGFCAIGDTVSSGIYRLDLPNAALASGVNDTTIYIKGVSGSNGAVVQFNFATVKAQLDTTQDIGDTTVGDALNAANAGGIGKWNLSGDLLYLYAADGTLVKKLRVKSLRLDV
jgi:hypothetical protein